MPLDIDRATKDLVAAVIAGYPLNPGHSDLDNEQPVHVSMQLGDVRKAWTLHYAIRDKEESR